MKVRITKKCSSLIEEYNLDRTKIIKQLDECSLEEGNLIIGYNEGFHYTLFIKKSKDNIVLYHIEKAIKFVSMDNSDLFT